MKRSKEPQIARIRFLIMGKCRRYLMTLPQSSSALKAWSSLTISARSASAFRLLKLNWSTSASLPSLAPPASWKRSRRPAKPPRSSPMFTQSRRFQKSKKYSSLFFQISWISSKRNHKRNRDTMSTRKRHTQSLEVPEPPGVSIRCGRVRILTSVRTPPLAPNSASRVATAYVPTLGFQTLKSMKRARVRGPRKSSALRSAIFWSANVSLMGRSSANPLAL
mmetsp:Transcript_38008/g.100545  ORF Transcript_38008/g.100545 Transcript_38008/m.100545 type:complete len:221 (+) Transcript_38008:862-1524(+)